MPNLSRPLVKDIVRESLLLVADVDGEFEQFNFRRFGAFHKQVFLSALKSKVSAVRRNPESHYDIELTSDTIDEWETLGACIDWILENSFTRRRQTTLLTRPDLEDA